MDTKNHPPADKDSACNRREALIKATDFSKYLAPAMAVVLVSGKNASAY